MKPIFAACAALLSTAAFAEPHVIQNVAAYKEPGRVGGWPANYGIWVWGNEIVVGFSQGVFLKNDRGHSVNRTQPDVHRFARSLDGGLTWTVEVPDFLDADGHEKEGTPCPGGLDFQDPNSCVELRMTNSAHGFSRFYYSKDRARTWQGPYALPTFDQKGIATRTDYIVDGPHTLTALMTASKTNGKEGRPFCTRTMDGGKTWDFIGWIGPEPKGFSIMPSSIRVSPTRIVTTIRRMEALDPSELVPGGVMQGHHFIDEWASDDNGRTWNYIGRPVESTGSANGSAQSMIRLKDGRFVLTYGYRSAPFDIRARISTDQGMTWGPEIVLRTGAGKWDLGYTRTVQRADGKIVTCYYYNDPQPPGADPAPGCLYLAATIWDAG